MTSIIKFTALSGAQDEAPPCYLLQVDDFCFLLDCGWDPHFNMATVEAVKRHLHQIDAILLSFPDLTHLGLLPYLMGRLELKCPVYATVPVYKMGQMFMYDLFQSRKNSEEFDLFSLDDVDTAFDNIIQVKFAQTVQLKGKGHGLTITAHAAGHMVGGTMWKIGKDEEEDIVYAIDYNHKKERHLDGALLESLSRPHLLITGAYNALSVQARRKERDQALLNNILTTLRRDGNVLIAVDTAGRVLELSQLLDQVWRNQESGLCAYSIALLSNVSYNVVEFAKSQVEWMSDKMSRMFEENRSNPFQFKHVTICHNLADLAAVREPKAVLASMSDLECGYSRDLFVQWASNPKNSIILTSRSAPGSLTRTLFTNLKLSSVDLEVRKRVFLEGEELEAHRQREKEKLAKETSEREAELYESSDEEMETGDNQATPTSPTLPPRTPKHDLMMVEEAKARSSFFKQAKSYPMFPCREDKVTWDEYGEPIRHEDYQQKEISTPLETQPMEADGEAEKSEEPAAVPTKCVAQKISLPLRCSLSFIDFEGLSDGDSVKRILSIVKPRQLILVHGSADSTNHLRDFARSSLWLAKGKLFTPRVGDSVDASTESHIYQVKLTDSLMSAVQFSHAKDSELAWVDGSIHFSSAAAAASEFKGQDVGEFKGQDVSGERRERGQRTPVLSALPHTQVKSHSSVFINPPRLADFKQVLNKAGLQAEFSGGVLVCNKCVAVRKGEGGRIKLEGTLCEEYYKVRQLLYEQFAII